MPTLTVAPPAAPAIPYWKRRLIDINMPAGMARRITFLTGATTLEGLCTTFLSTRHAVYNPKGELAYVCDFSYNNDQIDEVEGNTWEVWLMGQLPNLSPEFRAEFPSVTGGVSNPPVNPPAGANNGFWARMRSYFAAFWLWADSPNRNRLVKALVGKWGSTA